MLKAGLIGVGTIAKAHLSAYEQIKNEGEAVKLEAFCDIRPEQMEGLEGRKYTDIDTFLAEEAGKLDYVDICLPTYLHAEVAVKAMRAGFHVLSEKPMARNSDEAAAMISAAKETGKTLMVAHCMRFFGANRAIKRIVDSGELGKPCSAEFYREGGSKKPMGYQNWFRNAALSGGAMLDLHVHDVDIICNLFGLPAAVSAVGASRIPGATGYDAMSVNYMYPDGFFVNAKCDWSIEHDRFNTRGTRVNFENGYVFLDRSRGRTVFVKVDKDGVETDLMDQMDPNFYYNEIVYFADCLEKGVPVSQCLPEDSAKAIALVMAEMKSADQNGARVEL